MACPRGPIPKRLEDSVPRKWVFLFLGGVHVNPEVRTIKLELRRQEGRQKTIEGMMVE